MPIVLDGTQGISTPMYAGSISSNPVTPSVNMKNRIINGSMVIDQRNAGASVTATTSNEYTVDRWQSVSSQSSKYTVQQNAGSVTLPTGFTNYLGVTSSAATSLGAGDYFFLQQQIEGFNVADLGFGTANAKAITLSFQVYSSLTGTFGGSLANSSGNRSYPFTYTVSSANTWTTITLNIAGDTTGTWVTNNGSGLKIRFGLGVGSTYSGTGNAWAGSNYFSATGATSVVGTNGATFYITGVQLEVGSTATSFDYRPYGTELQLCLRYAYVATSDVLTTVFGRASTNAYAMVVLPTQMRASPTPTISGSLFVTNNAGSDITATSPSIAANGLSNIGGRMDIAGFNSSLSNGVIYGGTSQGASGKITFSAEL